MGFWRHITLGIRSLLNREDSDRDLADEMQHYMEEAEAELRAEGVSAEEARRTVRMRYGDGLAAREDVRRYGWENGVETLLFDLRLAARRLRRSPGFTTVAVLTLGLGVGAATAIFSAVSPVLFEPLPYPDADRIVSVADRSNDGSIVQVTFGTYRELSQRSRVFDALAVHKPWQPTLTGGDEPERLEAQRVSAGYFEVLGVPPALGGGLEGSADRPGGPDLVVLSHSLWRRRFGSDTTILGEVVYLDSAPFTVVGVMPQAFENVTAPQAQAWALMQYDPMVASFDAREWGHHLDMVGRLAPDIGFDEARQALNGIAAQPVAEFVRPSHASMGQGLLVRRLRDATMAGARPTMLVLVGAVGLLLVITCVNLTILLLARGARRQGELAMRATLGAGRVRLVRHLLTESLLLAALGGVLGLVIGRVGLAVLVAVSPPSLSRLDSIALDGTALSFALGLTTLVGVIIAVAPAMARSSGHAPEAVREAGRGSVRRSRSARQALVVTEVAVAMVLLIGAGLLFRSTQRLFSIPPGFDPAQTVVLQVYATGLPRGDATTHRFFDQALEAVQQVPGVRAAALTSQLPLSGDSDEYGLTLDQADRTPGIDGAVYRYAVSADYFESMGIPVLRGQGLDDMDAPGAVVSQSLASRLFPGRDPMGSRLHLGPTEGPPFTIVGVVADVKQASLETDRPDAVYVRSARWHWADRVRWLVVRADQDPEELVPAIRRAVWSVDGNQPIVRVQSMERLVTQSEAQRRFVLLVLMAFALSSLTVAGVGLFGVLSGSITERMREMGVRAALGASSESIVALVVRQGMTLTLVGVTIGVGAAAVASEALMTLLFDVSRLDPATYLAVVMLLASVSALACWIPAARAARVDPLAALRAE